MEEISRVRKKPASDDDNDKKVVELTPEMEIAVGKGGKIYDLTQAEDGTVYSIPEVGPSREPQAKESDPQPSAQPEIATSPVSEIEKEIDAAFEKIEPYSPIDLSDGLDERPPVPDKLDDLKQLADDVLSETSPAPEMAGAEGDEQAAEMIKDVPPSGTAPEATMDQREDADAADGPIDLRDIISSRDNFESLAEQPHEPVESQHNEAQEGEEIVDLMEIVPHQSSEQGSSNTISPSPETNDEEDGIIELVDIVSMKPQATAREDVASKVIEADDGDLIELTDIIEAIPETALNETGRPQLADSDADLDADQRASLEPEGSPDDDHVIQLSDILKTSRNKDVIETSPDQNDSGVDELDEMRDLSAGIGMVLEDQPAALSDETIEAAIERYIRARYGGDLERIIAAVVEKAVAREIEHLRRSFIEENGEPD